MSFFLELNKINNEWFFDDKSLGIYKEQFVNGMPEIIEALYPNQNKIHLEISDVPIFEADGILDNIQDPIYPDEVYYKYQNLVGWLCPVFRRYFEKDIPPYLWVRRI